MIHHMRALILSTLLALGLLAAACSDDPPVQQRTSETAAPSAETQQQQTEPAEEQQTSAAQQPQSQALAQQQDAAQPEPPAPDTAQEQAQPEPEQSTEQEAQQQVQQDVQHQPGEEPQPSEQQALTVRSLDGVRGIVDPSNSGWPREVEGLNGIVSIPAKPLRIITASIGHDEITLALVPNERLVAVGEVSQIETYSNVAALVQGKPIISRDPETIIAQSPDVVVTSPFYPTEGIDALQRAGIAVIQTELEQSPESRISAILLMGYIYGEEERAWEFADEVQARFDSLISVTSAKEQKPRVLALTQYSDTLWVAGANSTEGGVIEAGGGINAAAEAGIEGNQTTSLEGLIAMAPDVIVIAQPLEFGAEEFRRSLFENEALAEVPAIKNGAVHIVESKHFTTLSFWNIRGAEDFARILWPDDFPDPPEPTFSTVE